MTRLELGGAPIASVVAACLAVPGCAHVVLKCPFNTDQSGLAALCASSGRTGGGGGRAQLVAWSLSKRVKCLVVSAPLQSASGGRAWPTKGPATEVDATLGVAEECRGSKKRRAPEGVAGTAGAQTPGPLTVTTAPDGAATADEEKESRGGGDATERGEQSAEEAARRKKKKKKSQVQY